MSGPNIPDLAMPVPIEGIQAGTNSFTLISQRCIGAPDSAFKVERVDSIPGHSPAVLNHSVNLGTRGKEK